MFTRGSIEGSFLGICSGDDENKVCLHSETKIFDVQVVARFGPFTVSHGKKFLGNNMAADAIN